MDVNARKIKNVDGLRTSDIRASALEILEAGLQAIDTARVIAQTISTDGKTIKIAETQYDRGQFDRIIVIGVGKCALAAAKAIEEILGSDIDTGVVIDLRSNVLLHKIQALKGTHPSPSEENVRNAEMMIQTLHRLTQRDLVIAIVSGGGSTLLCLPNDKGCDEEEKILRGLTERGAAIQEINTVRKHLSLARGGYLAQYAYPARVISLIFSDVPGNDIEFVASGPTVKDTTTIEDARTILKTYNILPVCGITDCGLIETPKDEKYFERVTNILVASNAIALSAMKDKAIELGYRADIRDMCLEGEARDAARRIMEELHAATPAHALLYGGETTVTLAKNHGRGGRNLEIALAALRLVKDREILISLASDGRDNGEFAGAICDMETREKAKNLNMPIEPYLLQNNEYPFFEKVGHYIFTGDTGSNVSDLLVAIKG